MPIEDNRVMVRYQKSDGVVDQASGIKGARAVRSECRRTIWEMLSVTEVCEALTDTLTSSTSWECRTPLAGAIIEDAKEGFAVRDQWTSCCGSEPATTTPG